MYLPNTQYHTLRINESEVSKNPAILCTVEGNFITVNEVNNNNRGYTYSLVENKIRNNPTTIELMENKVLFGELSHPEERFDIDLNSVSHNITKLWWNEDNTVLKGRADILDTPAGRLVYTMIKYGSKMGISARARGTLIEENGVDYPEESTYTFKGFDFVPNPGFSSSRLEEVPVDESVKEDFIDSLNSYLDEANSSDIKSLRPIFESMGTDIYESIKEKIDLRVKEDTSFDKSYMDTLFEESIDMESKLELSTEENSTLKDKLDVLTKERDSLLYRLNRLEKDVASKKKSDEEIGDEEQEIMLKDKNIKDMEKAINSKTAIIESTNRQVRSLKGKVSLLNESLKALRAKFKAKEQRLNESISFKDKKIRVLERQCKAMRINESAKPKLKRPSKIKKVNESTKTKVKSVKPKLKKMVKVNESKVMVKKVPSKATIKYPQRTYYQNNTINESIVNQPTKAVTSNSVNNSMAQLSSLLSKID